MNLDAVETKKIELSEDNIVYNVNEERSENEPIIGRMSSTILVDGQFYIIDSIARAVFKIRTNEKATGPLTRKGKGPGEHDVINDIEANTNYIYLADVNSTRINRYRLDMTPVRPLQNYLSSLDIEVNDSIILTDNRNSSRNSPIRPDEGIVAISSIDNVADTIATIMPRIIPVGYQPYVYKHAKFSVNQNSNIAAIYRPLPWLFLFDHNYSLSKTLILEYSVFEDMDIPAMDFFKPKGNQGFGGSIPITRVKLMDNGDIFISIRRALIHLTESSNGDYQLAGKYGFFYDEEPIAVYNFFGPSDEGAYYIFSWNYIFKTALAN